MDDFNYLKVLDDWYAVVLQNYGTIEAFDDKPSVNFMLLYSRRGLNELERVIRIMPPIKELEEFRNEINDDIKRYKEFEEIFIEWFRKRGIHKP